MEAHYYMYDWQRELCAKKFAMYVMYTVLEWSYMYTYVHVHVCVCTYVHVFVCTCTYMCVCIHVHVHVCVCTCCLPQTISQLEADEVVTDFRHSTMSKEYTVFALSLYLTLHIRCAYLNYWNYPFASTRYSVTHEVCVFWSLEPSFC